MTKNITVSLRCDLEHLARIKEALVKQGIYAEDTSKMIRFATIGYLNYADPGWMERSPELCHVQDVMSMRENKRKGGKSTGAEMASLATMMQKSTGVSAPIATSMEMLQHPAEVMEREKSVMSVFQASCKDKENLLIAKRKVGNVFKELPETYRRKAQMLWSHMTEVTNFAGSDQPDMSYTLQTISDVLEGEIDEERVQVAALLLHELFPYNKELGTEEERKRVQEVLTHAVKSMEPESTKTPKRVLSDE